MKIGPLAIAVALLLSGFSHAASQYGLPVRLGSSSAQVRAVLGEPTEVIAPPGHEGMKGMDGDEWYDSAGIVGAFTGGRLTAITLFKETDYRGFVPYTGPIVNGVTLRDTKKTILAKLGRPTKIEDEKLSEGTNPDRPVINPQRSKYYWRFTDYTVQVTFLNQAQLIREAGPITLPKDSVIFVIVSK